MLYCIMLYQGAGWGGAARLPPALAERARGCVRPLAIIIIIIISIIITSIIFIIIIDTHITIITIITITTTSIIISITPNLPTNIIPTKIAWLELPGESPTDMRIPPLRIKIVIE